MLKRIRCGDRNVYPGSILVSTRTPRVGIFAVGLAKVDGSPVAFAAD